MSQSNNNPEDKGPGQVPRDTAACAREKNIAANGKGPVSVYMIAACGVALVVAGAILGSGGNLFEYGKVFRDGYKRASPPGANEGPPPKAALDAYMAKGKKVSGFQVHHLSWPGSQGRWQQLPVARRLGMGLG